MLENPNFIFAGLGLFGYLLIATWKLGASRWSTWFPLLRKACEFGLIGAAIGWAGVLLTHLPSDSGQTPTLAVFFFAGLLALPAVRLVSRRKPEEKTERGARVASAADVTKQAKKGGKSTDLALGGVPLLKDNEPYHFMIAGATGSGKSVAIRTLADTLRKRGDTVIMVDSGGEFINRYFDASRDHIINPFDARCAPWSPLAELDGPWDAQALSRSIVPDGVGDSKEWNGYAQTLVTSVLQKMAEEGDRRLGRFLYLVQQAPVAELQKTLVGTPALAQLSSEKTFGSIRTIASNYLLPYGYLTDSDDPFSVSRFVREHKPGFLFLSYRDDQLDSLRNLISAVLDVASRTLLALTPDSNRRIWLIIDEFASIGKVQSIEAVATKARKNGGCLLLGLQSISQIRDRYGEHAAQSILSCLSTWLVLRCTDAETSEYMSKYIGEAQVVRISKSESKNVSGDSDSASEQRTTERVVLASEVQALANLEGFLKVPGGTPVCRLKLGFPPKNGSDGVAFDQRDFKTNPMLNAGAYGPEGSKASTPASPTAPVAPRATAGEPPPSATAYGGAQLNRSGNAAPHGPTQTRTRGPVAPGAPASNPPVSARREAGSVPAPSSPRGPVRVTQVVAAPVPVRGPRVAPPTPAEADTAPFKSSRLNELLARKRAALAGEPVKVSTTVTDAAVRVAAAIAQRVLDDARKAQAEQEAAKAASKPIVPTRPSLEKKASQPVAGSGQRQVVPTAKQASAAPVAAPARAPSPIRAVPVAPAQRVSQPAAPVIDVPPVPDEDDSERQLRPVVPAAESAKKASPAVTEPPRQAGAAGRRRDRRGPGARPRGAKESGFER